MMMKEEFLHYVWQYKKFDFSNLTTVTGESIVILHGGQYWQQAGPDFFNAKVVIGSQKWAGTVEIHLKSSDWYVHHHERDPRYDNVILHVVWEYDTPVFRTDQSEIPTLELRSIVASETWNNYKNLFKPKKWINCENGLPYVSEFTRLQWQERLFFERLERKSNQLHHLLQNSYNDWEEVLFSLLAKNFGLHTNGDIFQALSTALSLNILRKIRENPADLEAVFFGLLQLFPQQPQDQYTLTLQRRYHYLKVKYRLEEPLVEPVHFFKLRPDNFPTIRLSQLAVLYSRQAHLFDSVIAAPTVKDLRSIFDCETTEYWQTHYNFDRESPKKRKKVSASFVDLLLINTVVPIRFAFGKVSGKDTSQEIIALLSDLKPEKNHIIQNFSKIGFTAKNALESQSLLQMKNEYCNFDKCLHCGIGVELLKSKKQII